MFWPSCRSMAAGYAATSASRSSTVAAHALGAAPAQSHRTRRRPSLLNVFDVIGLGAESLLRQRRLHEVVEITIEHRARVRGRNAGAQILDHLIGLQDVRADLVPPADVGLGGLLGFRGRLALLNLALEQFG